MPRIRDRFSEANHKAMNPVPDTNSKNVSKTGHTDASAAEAGLADAAAAEAGHTNTAAAGETAVPPIPGRPQPGEPFTGQAVGNPIQSAQSHPGNAAVANHKTANRKAGRTFRLWVWPLLVIGVAGGIGLWWAQGGGGSAEEQSDNQIESIFGSGATGNLDSSTSGQLSGQAEKPVIKGGITDLLNDYPLDQAEHPMDPLLLVAEKGLANLQATLSDYTATIERQERVNGRLLPTETIALKIRRARAAAANGGQSIPRSIYTKHLAPPSLAGQEAIYVEGANDGNIIAHTTGFLNVQRFYLPPTGFLAMRGSRYPMTEAGFEVLITRMLERGRRDREFGTCEVRVDRNASINNRSCTMFELLHPKKEGPYDFHIARIAIDDQLNLPIHYEALEWPAQPGGAPQLLERYTYSDIVINPGLPDIAFDPSNRDYQFPKQ